MLPGPLFSVSLCVLCVSVVVFAERFMNHRDTEHTEIHRETN